MHQEVAVVYLVTVLFGLIEPCTCVIPTPTLEHGLQWDYPIALYFQKGYMYKIILCFLCFIHKITLSIRQFKRIWKRHGLHRQPGHDRLQHHRVRNLVRVSTQDECVLWDGDHSVTSVADETVNSSAGVAKRNWSVLEYQALWTRLRHRIPVLKLVR